MLCNINRHTCTCGGLTLFSSLLRHHHHLSFHVLPLPPPFILPSWCSSLPFLAHLLGGHVWYQLGWQSHQTSKSYSPPTWWLTILQYSSLEPCSCKKQKVTYSCMTIAYMYMYDAHDKQNYIVYHMYMSSYQSHTCTCMTYCIYMQDLRPHFTCTI